MAGLSETPRGSRLAIGLFGRRNVGKSSLLNVLTHQARAVVSRTPGTTTDPVYQAMELHDIGPVLFIDTAGFDDDAAELGALRLRETERAAREADLALVLFPPVAVARDALECAWARRLRQAGKAVLAVVSQTDTLADGGRARAAEVARALAADVAEADSKTDAGKEDAADADGTASAGGKNGGQARTVRKKEPPPVLCVSVKEERGLEKLRRALARLVPPDFGQRPLTEGLCEAGDVVLLVMPQDREAPKGRLILPQVQTIRELLDRRVSIVACQTEDMAATLARLREPPQLIITDSQAFRAVHALAPAASRVTSFSVLFAAQKGDLDYFLAGARALLALAPGAPAHILIAEACTHHPIAEDIGRVKIPRLLRKRLGEGIQIDVVSGRDFPANLKEYTLMIHCGSCMFNRSYVLSRVAEARAAGVPMTNYGLAIAALLGILPDVALPGAAGESKTTR